MRASVASSSEEGFHSSPQSQDAYSIDRLQHNLSKMDLFEQRMFSDLGLGAAMTQMQQQHNGSSTLLKGGSGPRSDSGASSGGDHDTSDKGMKEDRLPGAWFYEVGDGGSSPVHDDEFGLRAALSSRNVTETVEVPSSEHVAEIVGRQGCKIKALRAKTNTYIKTPIRGEDPLFTVTGRMEDVAEAKKEIELAAEHFTQIRATRKHSGVVPGMSTPGHVTAYVRVPLRVVGLVVGPKGATIKRIQQDTHTYIITPSREREPIFEVTGLPHNVETARDEIQQHIFQRTGNLPITDPTASLSREALQNTLQSSAQRAKMSLNGMNLNDQLGGVPSFAASYAAAMQVQARRAALGGIDPSTLPHDMQISQLLLTLNGCSDMIGSTGHNLPHQLGSPSFYSMPPPSSSSISRSITPSNVAGLHAMGGPYRSNNGQSSAPWTAPLGVVTNNTAVPHCVGSNGSSSGVTGDEWISGGSNGWQGSMNSNTMNNGSANGMMRGGMTMKNTINMMVPRDEGLGDSPPTTVQIGNKDTWQGSMMSSIWSSADVENTAPLSGNGVVDGMNGHVSPMAMA